MAFSSCKIASHKSICHPRTSVLCRLSVVSRSLTPRGDWLALSTTSSRKSCLFRKPHALCSPNVTRASVITKLIDYLTDVGPASLPYYVNGLLFTNCGGNTQYNVVSGWSTKDPCQPCDEIQKLNHFRAWLSILCKISDKSVTFLNCGCGDYFGRP